ncbi:MAG: hypothetical protein Alpg2KO_01400 [Alphaproteobacteria bacterium]
MRYKSVSENSRRGASMLSHGLLVGLISIIALVTIQSIGGSVTTLMTTTADAIEGPATQAVSGSGESQSDPQPLQVTGALTVGDPGRWSDGSYAVACWDYLTAPSGGTPASVGDDGTYTIDPDGSGPVQPFDVYCDMTIDGGGWTMVDVVAVDGEFFASRVASSSAASLSVTGGHQLPGYSWSANGQLLCKANEYTGTLPWRTYDVPPSSVMRSYPTTNNVLNSNGGASGMTSAISNGNTYDGTSIWVYSSSVRIGALYISSIGSTPGCACGYRNGSSTYEGAAGLGTFVNNTSSGDNRCSTYVR